MSNLPGGHGKNITIKKYLTSVSIYNVSPFYKIKQNSVSNKRPPSSILNCDRNVSYQDEINAVGENKNKSQSF